jgi:uncharacterized membrane protein YebE (DUF533 family)
MTTTTPQAVLAEVAALAADHGWLSVGEFTSAVPEHGARDITILAAEGTEPGPLAAWIGAQDSDGGTPAVSSSALEALAAEPGSALRPNRVVVALRCGQLLTSDAAAAASAVLARPAGTYRVVLTGAEELRSAEDLTVVERGLWRVLLAPDGQAWRGQDIAARGCLLWSDQEAPEPAGDRIARDVAALREWLGGPVGASPDLDRGRAACAISLALDALGETPVTARETRDSTADADAALDARRLADLAAELHGLRDRLLSRLDSDAASTERQVLASLDILAQDLVSAQAAGRAVPADYAARSVEQWVAETRQLLGQRLVSAREDARHLLEQVDWDLVNQVAPHPHGNRYPGAILDEFSLQAVSLPAGALPAAGLTSAGPGAEAQDWTSALRSVNGGVLVTAGLGAAALALLGLPLVPVAGAAALGVLGGSAYQARQRAEEARKRAQQLAEATVPGSIANASSAIGQVLREQAAASRAAVDGQLTLLDRSLGEAAERAAGPARTPDKADGESDGQLRARLGALLGQLEGRQDGTARSDGS